MGSRTKTRTIRGWDVGLAAAILAVVLLAWLTAPGSDSAVSHFGGGHSLRAHPAAKTLQRPPGRGAALSLTRPALP